MDLTWKQWKTLDSDARIATATEVVASLRSTGLRLGEPRLEVFGPPDDAQQVAIVEDVERGTWFSLVPGGRLKPGLGDREMEKFWELEEAWLQVLGLDLREHERPYTALDWSADQLARDTPVVVPTMLVAMRPLSAKTLGVQPPRHSVAPLLTWDEAQHAAQKLGYAMPTTWQLEWATTAGIPSLFYWGDDLPDPVHPCSEWRGPEDFEVRSADFAQDYMGLGESDVAPWPTSNRFGLQGAAGQPVWSEGPAGEALVAGGADRYFPWQGCGEWLWLLSALRVDVRDIRDHQGAMFRPAILIPT